MTDPDHAPSYEETKERRRRRRWLVGLPLAVALLAGLYPAVPPAVRGIRGWQARRLAREAEDLIGRGQWQEASRKASDALHLRFSEPEPWRAVAQLLTRTGQQSAALPWWRKLDAAHRLTLEDRREYAGAALFADALPEAAGQIRELPPPGSGSAPIDTLLASQLASRQGDAARATGYARRAMTDPRAQPHEQMSAVLQLLTLASRDSSDYAAAWARLLGTARDPANPMSLDALNLLADPRLAAPTGARPLFAPGREASADAPGMGPGEIAAALDAHPRARPQDHLLAWELRVRADPAHTDERLAEAGARFGGSDDRTLAGLTQFLDAQGHPEITLQVLPRERAEQTPELSAAYLDALAALGRWQEIKDALAANRLRLNPVAQHEYLAVARAKTNEPEGADIEWQRALEAASHDPGSLLAVAARAEKAGALAAADAAYAAAIEAAPTQRAAYAGRGQLALQRGQTAVARQMSAELARRWPEDAPARATAAYLDLLLGATGADAERDGQTVAPQALQQPPVWSARATLALARLRGGQTAAALAAFSGDRGTMNPQAQPGADVPNGAQAVWAAALAANGWRTEAEGAARRLTETSLLPEERALIAPLLTPVASP